MSLFDATTEKFRALDKIGVGRFCEIRKFNHYGSGRFERSFVLKRLLNHETEDLFAVAALEHEAVMLAGLSHPNIVSAFDFQKNKDGGCIFLEWVPGLDLKRLLDAKGGLDPLSWWALMLALTDIVADLQTGGGGVPRLIHRDLVPGNIIVEPTGHLKIIDFASAASLNDRDSLEVNAQHPIFRGRAGFLPPEMYAEGDVDTTFDVFMLGVLAYRMAVGYLPFRGNSAEETVHEVLAKKPVFPSKIQKEFSKIEDEIVMGCLEKNPLSRISSARELSIEIRTSLLKTKYVDECLNLQGIIKDAFYESV